MVPYRLRMAKFIVIPSCQNETGGVKTEKFSAERDDNVYTGEPGSPFKVHRQECTF